LNDLDTAPQCGVSVRIGWVNYNRGPGCYLHSQGHGIENTASSGIIPQLRDWFIPFANFDMNQKYGTSQSSLYWTEISCSKFLSKETEN